MESSQDPLNYPIRLNNRLSALVSVVSTGDNAPTAQAYQVRDELIAEIDGHLEELYGVLGSDLDAFNDRSQSSENTGNLRRRVVSPVPSRPRPGVGGEQVFLSDWRSSGGPGPGTTRGDRSPPSVHRHENVMFRPLTLFFCGRIAFVRPRADH